jgi:hypothetical protein
VVKARLCKSCIVGSIPTLASNLFYIITPLANQLAGIFFTYSYVIVSCCDSVTNSCIMIASSDYDVLPEDTSEDDYMVWFW